MPLLTAYEFSGATRLSCGAERSRSDGRRDYACWITRVASAAKGLGGATSEHRWLAGCARRSCCLAFAFELEFLESLEGCRRKAGPTVQNQRPMRRW